MQARKVDDLDEALDVHKRKGVFNAAIVAAADAGVLTAWAEQDAAP